MKRARSDGAEMVRIALPPPIVTAQPLFTIIAAGTRLVRIFNPAAPWNIRALTFSHFGPRHRFDHHRLPPSGIASPWNDPDRSIYYAGWTLSCCIAECFGDTLQIDQPDFQVAYPLVNRSLRLLDLCGNGAL